MAKVQYPFGEIKSPNEGNQVKSLEACEFGKRLRTSAIECGVNQKLLAEMVGIPASTIGRYWHGQRLLPIGLLFPIADCLKVDPRWLATGKPPGDDAMSTDEYELLLRFRTLTKSQREHLLQGAELLGAIANAHAVNTEK
jgi:transcriptional regulator with XRE-family HTH domain